MQNHLRTACCATLALFLSAGLAGAAEIKLISVGGVKSGLDPIIAAYEKETGNHVNYTAGAPAAAFVKFLASAKAADGWKAGRLEPPAK
jgi:accessory colonization factor AcfC